eukprot:scaffold5019_cov131-Skeletonema_dohrnii-CCMP3373.AAC.9
MAILPLYNFHITVVHYPCMLRVNISRISSAVQYLVGLGATTLEAVDRKGSTALHLVCRGAKYETIALLLDKYDDDEKLRPWESNEVLDRERESVEYTTEGAYRLLRAYPETMNTCMV